MICESYLVCMCTCVNPPFQSVPPHSHIQDQVRHVSARNFKARGQPEQGNDAPQRITSFQLITTQRIAHCWSRSWCRPRTAAAGPPERIWCPAPYHVEFKTGLPHPATSELPGSINARRAHHPPSAGHDTSPVEQSVRVYASHTLGSDTKRLGRALHVQEKDTITMNDEHTDN